MHQCNWIRMSLDMIQCLKVTVGNKPNAVGVLNFDQATKEKEKSIHCLLIALIRINSI